MILTSLRIAAVVGTVLNVINYGDAMLGAGAIPWGRLLLNFCVPFCVATYSAIRNEQARATGDSA